MTDHDLPGSRSGPPGSRSGLGPAAASQAPLSVPDALGARRSIRAYLPTPVPVDLVDGVLADAARAPSSKNTQPWRVVDLRGAALDALRADLLTAFDAERAAARPYRYGPDPLPPAWQERARAVGYSLFAHKGIERRNLAARRAHDRQNHGFFGAPHALVLSTEPDAGFGTFLDLGAFFHAVMLGLAARGIGSCPMFSTMAYADVIVRHLPDADRPRLLVATLAYGYPADAHVNDFRTDRAPLDEWRERLG